MATLGHIALLCRSFEEWNRARADEGFIPNLSHVEIRKARLGRLDLRGVELDGARLIDVDLREARLEQARLNGVRAIRTSFQGALLTGGELKGADFTQVSFRDAVLSGIVSFDLKIRHCDLRRADFSQADLRDSHFYNSDLRGAVFEAAKLERAVFKRPRLEHEAARALELAGAQVMLLDEAREGEWLDWDRFDPVTGVGELGTVRHEDKLYWISEGRWDFFISHASVDKEAIAGPLAEALRRLEQRVWYDEHEIRLGDNLDETIQYGLRSSLFGVVILSKDFFGRRWTEAEFEVLQNRRIFLVRHGVTLDELENLRPELTHRRSISSDVGPAKSAEALLAAIRTPRPDVQ